MNDFNPYSLEPFWDTWYIDSLISEGSFGAVYKIYREELGTKYYSALKIISIPKTATEEKQVSYVNHYFQDIVEVIQKEIATMTESKGKTNIVSYEDHKIIQKQDGVGLHILIRMELLENLNDYILHRKFTNVDVVNLGMDLCMALILGLKRNLILRDIKPANIFVSLDGDYKLGDFGIVRQSERSQDGLSFKGTYGYMDPEVYLDNVYDKSVDIYSLGMVLYYYLNDKKSPFSNTTSEIQKYSERQENLTKRFSEEKLQAPLLASEHSSEIIRKDCEDDPNNRDQTQEDFLAAPEELPKFDLEEKNSILEEKSTVLEEKSTVLEEKSTVLEEKSTILGEKSSILENYDRNIDTISEKSTFALEFISDNHYQYDIPVATEWPKHAFLRAETTSVQASSSPVEDERTLYMDEATILSEKPVYLDNASEATVLSEKPVYLGNASEATVLSEKPVYLGNASEATVLSEKPVVLDEASEAAVLSEKPADLNEASEETELSEKPVDLDETSEAAVLSEKPVVLSEASEETKLSEKPVALNEASESTVLSVKPVVLDEASEAAVLSEKPVDLGSHKPVDLEEKKPVDLGEVFEAAELREKSVDLGSQKPVDFVTQKPENLPPAKRSGRAIFAVAAALLLITTGIVIFFTIKKPVQEDTKTDETISSASNDPTTTSEEISPTPKVADETVKVADYILELDNSKLENCSSIDDINKLTSLSIAFNKLSSLEELKDSIWLEYLNVQGNRIKALKALSKMDHLTCLNAMDNQISDISPIRNLKSLEILILSNNRIRSVDDIIHMKSLTELRIDGNKDISDISVISQLKNLKTLTISGTDIKDITSLYELKNLTWLDLSNTNIPTKQIKKFKSKVPECEIIQ